MIMICSSLFVPLTSGPIKFLQTFYPVLITCLYQKDIKIQNLDILEIPFRMNFKMCSSHYTAWKMEVISELDELCNIFPKSQFAIWNRGNQRCCDSALLSTAATSCRVLRGFRDAREKVVSNLNVCPVHSLQSPASHPEPDGLAY